LGSVYSNMPGNGPFHLFEELPLVASTPHILTP
jgi:hypothetical protein